jgi:hypothetical protein
MIRLFTNSDSSDGGRRTSRILLIAGVVVGVITVISWFAFDSGGKHTKNQNPTVIGCRVPSGGTAGTEAAPNIVTALATPLGPPNTTATLTANDTTVYVYCYNRVTGSQVSTAIATLRAGGYDEIDSQDPVTQIVFTQDATTPYGVNLTVSGGLDASNPMAQSSGGLSITWIDTKPSG